MPVAVDPNARLSACKFCFRVFLHQPDVVDPTIDHEWTCERNPAAPKPINLDFSGASTGTTATVIVTQKPIDSYSPIWTSGPT